MPTTLKNIDAAIAALEKQPLNRWDHASAFLAVANTAATHIDLYKVDAEDYLKDYFEEFIATPEKLFAPACLLAVARLYKSVDTNLRVSCLRRCVSEVQAMMSTQEQDEAFLGIADKLPEVPAAKQELGAGSDPAARWSRLQEEPEAVKCPAMDELMKMIGLMTVKEKLLQLYNSVQAERRMPARRRLPQTHNFVMLGNPGTGKTTVAKLVAQLLQEMGVRPNGSLIATTGEKLARMGADKVSDLIESAIGGTLFIDEAYHLEPEKNADAAAVAMQLLDVAEERRTELTIILAGYKDDMEKKLFDFNDGFSRRFNYTIVFEDYTEEELASIFEQMCLAKEWPPSCPDVIKVAARRVSRGRGSKSFGNAGAVRVLFETAYKRALSRDPGALCLEVVDIIGPPLDRKHIPDLDAALNELEQMIGLTRVKEQLTSLVQLARTNYDRELQGEPPYTVPLNRLFLGNPGTGKTTVAKLYGRILKSTGFLSDGAPVLTQPSDFLGSHVGETPRRTTKLIKRCRGKVLIVDEAYGLNNSTYGREALDTLVSMVHGAPGEDIAVVMIGYEKQMKKMFREANPGLTRRFGLEHAFLFEDFSDTELDRVVNQAVQAAGLIARKKVRMKVIKALGMQRARPNFGNAGDAVAIVGRAKQRIAARDPESKSLILADFALDSAEGNGLSALQGLYKVKHIEQELLSLQVVVQQCDRDGKDRSEHLKNYIFLGNPGTGKTTIARAMAQMLHEIGLLASNSIRICSGLDLQGSYVGQTKDKVNEAMAEAQGGVLFIDEAYTLGGGTTFAQEAIDQLVQLMTEPEHLHKTVVILAGYKEEMEHMLAGANTGLKSRITGRISFPDWDATDCVEVITATAKRDGITLTAAASQLLVRELAEIKLRPGWSNARDSITVQRLLYKNRAQRLLSAAEETPSYVPEDVSNSIATLREQRPKSNPVENPVLKRFQFATAPQLVVTAPPKERVEEKEADLEEVISAEEKVAAQDRSDGDGAGRVYSALLEACKQAGYDADHEKRKELILLLQAVQQGQDFPPPILAFVLEKTGLKKSKAVAMLRPQVHRVLVGMENAVQAEQERLEELRRLDEKERARQEAAHRQWLRTCGPCPAGYSWHRCGSGWRCAGGSHFVTEDQLPRN